MTPKLLLFAIIALIIAQSVTSYPLSAYRVSPYNTRVARSRSCGKSLAKLLEIACPNTDSIEYNGIPMRSGRIPESALGHCCRIGCTFAEILNYCGGEERLNNPSYRNVAPPGAQKFPQTNNWQHIRNNEIVSDELAVDPQDYLV